MKKIKTLKALIKILILIERQPLDELKGYEKLSANEQKDIGELVAGISNTLNEIDSQKYL